MELVTARAQIGGSQFRLTGQLRHDFAEEHPAIIPIDQFPYLADTGMGLRAVTIEDVTLHIIGSRPCPDDLGIVAQRLILGNGVDDIEAKAIDTTLEPEPDHSMKLIDHLRVAPIQIRLLAEEGVHIILATQVIEAPGPPSEGGYPVIGYLITPDVVVCILPLF